MDLSKFNPNQRQAITHIDGACCVLAGAGSGKTSVLTNRIAYMIEQGINPENILAVTFTKKASEEMKERLHKLIGDESDLVNIGTFHSICYSVIRDSIAKDLTIMKEWWAVKTVKEIMSPPSNKYPYGIDLDWKPQQALSFISLQKNHLVDPDGCLLINEGQKHIVDKLNSLYKEYEKIKKLNGFIDFDDMLLYTYKLFNEKPNILERYRKKFKYILCDEFQDTNVAQHEILKQIAALHKNLFVVGDDFQSIYKFRGANIDLILNFEKEWNAKVVKLDINYRCSGAIVDWSNKLIDCNKRQCEKLIKADNAYKCKPSVVRVYDNEEEATVIAREIDAILKDGENPDEIAVLYRTNAQSRPFEEQLNKLDIPFVIIGGGSFFERKEIQDMVAYLRLSVDRANDIAFERVFNAPNRFLGKVFREQLTKYANDNCTSLLDSIEDCYLCRNNRNRRIFELLRVVNHVEENKLTPFEAIKHIRQFTGYDSWLNKEFNKADDGVDERIEALDSLQSMASKFDTISEFLNNIDEMASKSSDKNEKGKIKLMTIHRSKGLEFKHVYVVGWVEGLLPHKNAETESDIEEERRLAYVAMTRAKEFLTMSYFEVMNDEDVKRSIFIDELLNKEKKVKMPWE